ncbi:conserved hypothetical protein [Gloeothece citriformis PCC 7424]|uniref:Uncharacterized protein n=1 Tax=Gloeothece citriformis (strain PCC 7424) TaxID=65393 RepID=B7KFX0_GLOC7|nr:hypothetical protein [Gloeothece citriformis]ACK69163.1 conserved hypothetical protein [Gloeothece citriformis PCC 7424]
MARYTCSILVNTPVEQLHNLLSDILHSCEFEVIYQALDYIRAREIPGKIIFSKLVSVDVFIDKATIKNNQVSITWVVKNDELPLHQDNHCWQRFEQIQEAIYKNCQWDLVNCVAS